MVIPAFDRNGNLPPGVHNATLQEIKKRFAYSRHRQNLFDGLLLLVQELKRANCKRLYLNGSFITTKELPNDYDVCWEVESVSELIDPLLLNPFKRLVEIKTKYRGDVFPRIPELSNGLDHLAIFQRDIDANAKGIIAIELR